MEPDKENDQEIGLVDALIAAVTVFGVAAIARIPIYMVNEKTGYDVVVAALVAIPLVAVIVYLYTPWTKVGRPYLIAAGVLVTIYFMLFSSMEFCIWMSLLYLFFLIGMRAFGY